MRASRRQYHDTQTPRLTHTITRSVRFEEVDPLNIMWHGRYASWLEDGREVLGKAYTIHYLDFYAAGVLIPIKVFHLEFFHPLRYGHSYSILTSLLWSDAALLDMEYTIYDVHQTRMTTACTTQLMLTLDGVLLLEQPEFFRAFRQRWHEGALSP